MLVPPKIMKLTALADKETSSRYALSGIRFERDQSGKPFAVATDGRRLASVSWSEDSPENYPAAAGFFLDHKPGFETVLSIKDCQEAAKLAPKKCFKPILENVVIDESANGTLNYGATDLERTRLVNVRTLEGRYPRWREVCTEPAAIVDVPQKYEATDPVMCKTAGPVDEFGNEPEPAAATYGDYVEICIDPVLLADICKVAKEIACDEDSRGVTLQIPLDHNRAMRIVKKHAGIEFTGVLMPLAANK